MGFAIRLGQLQTGYGGDAQGGGWSGPGLEAEVIVDCRFLIEGLGNDSTNIQYTVFNI
jgi:hypothetical protein